MDFKLLHFGFVANTLSRDLLPQRLIFKKSVFRYANPSSTPPQTKTTTMTHAE